MKHHSVGRSGGEFNPVSSILSCQNIDNLIHIEAYLDLEICNPKKHSGCWRFQVTLSCFSCITFHCLTMSLCFIKIRLSNMWLLAAMVLCELATASGTKASGNKKCFCNKPVSNFSITNVLLISFASSLCLLKWWKNPVYLVICHNLAM